MLFFIYSICRNEKQISCHCEHIAQTKHTRTIIFRKFDCTIYVIGTNVFIDSFGDAFCVFFVLLKISLFVICVHFMEIYCFAIFVDNLFPPSSPSSFLFFPPNMAFAYAKCIFHCKRFGCPLPSIETPTSNVLFVWWAFKRRIKYRKCVCVSVCASSLSIDRVKIAIGKIESPQRGQQHQSTTTKCDMFFVNILALCDFVASVPFNRTAERLKIQRNWLKRKGREAERASKKSQYLTFSISRKLASNFNFPTRNQCNVNAAACEAKMPSEKCSFSKSISVCCRIDKKLERKSEFDKIRLVASVFGVAAAVCCLCFWFRIGVVIVVDCFGQRTTESKSKSENSL